MTHERAAEEALVQRLALPLAHLHRRASNARSSLERHLAAFYLWEASLKLLGSVCVVEYARLDHGDEALNRCLENLARPALGHWWAFVRDLTPVLAQRGVFGFEAVRDLLLGRKRDDLPRAAGLSSALREVLEGRSAARATVSVQELFDQLVYYRNKEIGHGAAGQRNAEHYQRMGRSLLLGTTELLERLDVLAGRTLIHISEVRQVQGAWQIEWHELVGESGRRLPPLELPLSESAALPAGERLYLKPADSPAGAAGLLTALYPLVIYDAESNEFSFLNARRGKAKAEYLCYSTGRAVVRTDLGSEHRALLARALGLAAVSETEAGHWETRSQGEESGPAPAPQVEPRMVGEFEVLGELGRGGMGVVYRARQPSLDREVALKVLAQPGDPRAEVRFRREIRALGQVDHPHLVKVFASGSDAERWFYVMELVEGAPLSAVWSSLQTRGSSATTIDLPAWQQALADACTEACHRVWPQPLPSAASPLEEQAEWGSQGYVRRVVVLLRQVAQAAEALHLHGIIHRDVKPGNILVNAEGDHATLMDLGVAQLTDEMEGRLTRTRQFVGTLRYASPEQVLAVAPVDGRSDVYNLGATLWELLALRPLFDATEDTPTHALMTTIQQEEPQRLQQRNPGVGRDLEAVVSRCLEKKPSDRYQTARELADDLGRWLAGEPVRARPVDWINRKWKWVRRHPREATVCSLAVLVVLLLGYVGWLLSHRPDRPFSSDRVGPAPDRASPAVAEEADKFAPAVVLQLGNAYRATGFLIEDGWVMTAAHVVSNARPDADGFWAAEVWLTRLVDGQMVQDPKDSRRVSALIYKEDRRADLALLKLRHVATGLLPLPYLRLASAKKLKTGLECVAIGHLLGDPVRPRYWVSSKGKVINPSIKSPLDLPEKSSRKIIESSCQISWGYSGAPLVNLNGEVIGVTIGMGTSADETAVAYHVHLDEVKAFLQEERPAKGLLYPRPELPSGWAVQPQTDVLPVELFKGFDMVRVEWQTGQGKRVGALLVDVKGGNTLQDRSAVEAAVKAGKWPYQFAVRWNPAPTAYYTSAGKEQIDLIVQAPPGQTTPDAVWRLSDGKWMWEGPTKGRPLVSAAWFTDPVLREAFAQRVENNEMLKRHQKAGLRLGLQP